MASIRRGEGPLGRLRYAVLSQASGAALLIATTLAVPWVHYRLAGDASGHSLGPGVLTPELVAVAVAVLAMCVLEMTRRAVVVAAVIVAVTGFCGFALTVVAAAGRMAHANDLTIGGGDTAYSVGPILGAVAAAAMTLGALLVATTAPRISST